MPTSERTDDKLVLTYAPGEVTPALEQVQHLYVGDIYTVAATGERIYKLYPVDIKAIGLLKRFARQMKLELGDREWHKLDGAFSTSAYEDHRDAEFHLRALARILESNEAATKDA